MLSPPPDSESAQHYDRAETPEKFLHSTICLIADLHNDLELEFQALLKGTCPDNSYDRALEDLRGSRLEAFKRKLGETARQLALKRSGLLLALQACRVESLDTEKVDQQEQTEIIESAATLRFAVTTLGIFTVTAGMKDRKFHPLQPIARVMNTHGRVKNCLLTLERLRTLLLAIERSFPNLDCEESTR